MRKLSLALAGAAFCTAAALAQSDTDSSSSSAGTPPDFTVIVLPDYQYISSNCDDTQFTSIVNWIQSNQSSLNILAVVSEGDSTDTPDIVQWSCFETYFFSPLMALGIPVIVAPGNHDYDPALPIVDGQPPSPEGRSLTVFTSNILSAVSGQSAYQASYSPGATALYKVQTKTAGSGQTPGAYSVTGRGGDCSQEPVISVIVEAAGTVTAQPSITTPGLCSGAAPRFTLTGAGGTAATFQGVLTGQDAAANYWIKISDGGFPFGFLSLGFCPIAADVKWATSVMSANSSIPFMVVTHAYAYPDNSSQPLAIGVLSTPTSGQSCADGGKDGVNDSNAYGGQQMWNVFKANPNIYAVVSGHFVFYPTVFAAEITETGDSGNNVPTMYFNHQADPGSNAWVRILQVQPMNGQIAVSTYNPSTAAYLPPDNLADGINNFTVPAGPKESTKSPVAYVYVSSTAGIQAFDAAANGRLYHIPGSPFAGDLGSIAANAEYLFGTNPTGTFIDTNTIESGGALRYTISTNVNAGCGRVGPIFLDRTGSTLYDFFFEGQLCANNTYQAYKVEESTGKLSFLGLAGDSEDINGPPAIIGNDKYAYTNGCYHSSGGITGFRRNSSGSWTQLNINPRLPTSASGSYCGYGQAADPTNHVAFAFQLYSGNLYPSGPMQLATYTANSSGDLTTTSNNSNMPAVLVGNVKVMNVSPSGKLLAVGGSGGLQVFHFNGASPITQFTGLLTPDVVDEIQWDNHNHLYAVGNAANKLWVFTVTPSGYVQPPGSPYTINAPGGLAVLPLPL